MTPQAKQLIRDTWQEVLPIAPTAAQMFYDRLFEIDPSVRPLFKDVDMAQQHKKLLHALVQVVQGLDSLELLVPTLEDLGRRHADYGVTDAHYDSVGAALLWTLEQGLGEHWSSAAAAAWMEAYSLIADTMRAGAQAAVPPFARLH